MLPDLDPDFAPDSEFLPGLPVPSPCVLVCRLEPTTGWCEGCQRTRDEVAAWPEIDDAAKRLIWTQIRRRRDG